MYQFTSGSRVSGVSADVAGAELERIRNERGRLMPPDVVEEAEPVTAPLHPAFEWEDDKAAHQWRLIQARQLIRSIQITKPDTDDAAPRRIYVHVSQEEGYQPIDLVVRRPDLLDLARTALLDKLQEAQRSLKELQDAAREQPDVDRERFERVGQHLTQAREELVAVS